jgi:hypothetical protein
MLMDPHEVDTDIDTELEMAQPPGERKVTVTVTLVTAEPMTWAESYTAAALALLNAHGPKRAAGIKVTGAVREAAAA